MEEQIAVALGLAGFPNDGPQRNKILQQAKNYCSRCHLYGGRWVSYHSWLDEPVFLFIRKMVTNSCTKTWEMVASNRSEVNVWEEKAKECRARRALALSMGKHIDSVSIEDVNKAEGGLNHWANVSICIEAKGAKAKAKPKAKPEAGAESGTKSLAALERVLKNLIAQEMLLQKATEDLKIQREVIFFVNFSCSFSYFP